MGRIKRRIIIGFVVVVALLITGGLIAKRMAIPLNVSDVNMRLDGFYLQTNKKEYICDKTQDPLYFYYDDLGRLSFPIWEGNDKMLISSRMSSSTDATWHMDLDEYTMGMPNWELNRLLASKPCDSGGNILDEYEAEEKYIEYSVDGIDYMFKLFQTHVLMKIEIVITPTFVYEIDHSYWYVKDYFTYIEAEFVMSYNTYPEGSPNQIYVAETGGSRITGEFAFAVEVDKLAYVEDQDLNEGVFLKSAITSIACVEKQYSFLVTYFNEDPVKAYTRSESPNVAGLGGSYSIQSAMSSQLLYQELIDCVQKVDYVTERDINSMTLEDNWLPYVYIPIDFDVELGGKISTGVGDALNVANTLVYVSQFKTELSYVVTVLSAYQLHIEDSPTYVVTTDVDPISEGILADIWNTIVGTLSEFWRSGIVGKVVLIGVPVILIGVGGGTYAINRRKKSGNTSGFDDMIINLGGLAKDAYGSAKTKVKDGVRNKINRDKTLRKVKDTFGKAKRTAKKIKDRFRKK